MVTAAIWKSGDIRRSLSLSCLNLHAQQQNQLEPEKYSTNTFDVVSLRNSCCGVFRGRELIANISCYTATWNRFHFAKFSYSAEISDRDHARRSSSSRLQQ